MMKTRIVYKVKIYVNSTYIMNKIQFVKKNVQLSTLIRTNVQIHVIMLSNNLDVLINVILQLYIIVNNNKFVKMLVHKLIHIIKLQIMVNFVQLHVVITTYKKLKRDNVFNNVQNNTLSKDYNVQNLVHKVISLHKMYNVFHNVKKVM